MACSSASMHSFWACTRTPGLNHIGLISAVLVLSKRINERNFCVLAKVSVKPVDATLSNSSTKAFAFLRSSDSESVSCRRVFLYTWPEEVAFVPYQGLLLSGPPILRKAFSKADTQYIIEAYCSFVIFSSPSIVNSTDGAVDSLRSLPNTSYTLSPKG